VDDLVVRVEFHQVDCVHRRTTVVADEEFGYDQVSPSVEAADLEGEVCWVQTPPLAEVLHTLIALTALWKLEDSIIGIDLMSDVLVLTGVFPPAWVANLAPRGSQLAGRRPGEC
jgi:hypothetical protein